MLKCSTNARRMPIFRQSPALALSSDAGIGTIGLVPSVFPAVARGSRRSAPSTLRVRFHGYGHSPGAGCP